MQNVKILEAISAIRAEVEHIGKPDKNDFHKYSYAGEAAISRALRPLLEKYGLVFFQSAVGDQAPEIDANGITSILFDFTIAHTSGEVWPKALRVVGQGSDKNSKGVGDKGANKANTAAFKYFLNRLFMLNTGDDPDADEPAKPKRKANPDRKKLAHGEKQPRADDAQATAGELQKLGRACSAKAEELAAGSDGEGVPENLAKLIRNAARAAVGLDATEPVPAISVKSLAAAIDLATLDADLNIAIGGGP